MGGGHRRPELLTLDELTERTGVSARNVRFYASRGLVPSPIRRGRSGYYGPDHVARLELVRELQGHGFTLSAIEKYVDAHPRHRHALRHRAAPVDARAGHRASATSTSPEACPGLGISPEAAEAVAEVYAEHGRQVADELSEIVRTMVWPAVPRARGHRRGAARVRAPAQAVDHRRPGDGLRAGHRRELGVPRHRSVPSDRRHGLPPLRPVPAPGDRPARRSPGASPCHRRWCSSPSACSSACCRRPVR